MRVAKSASRPTCVPERGFTLAEMLVASAVAGMLLLTLFMIYRICASAWMKGDTQTKLRQSAMVASEKLSRDLERSIYDSVSISADRRGISFLSALDANGQFQFNTASQEPIWQNYLVYYLDPGTREFRRRSVSVAGAPQQSVPGPIESFGPNQLVDTYMVGGQAVAHELDFCEFTVVNKLLRLKLRAQAKRYGSERLESFELETVSNLRN